MTKTTHTHKRSEDRRALLMRTAEDLFARRGIDAVSLNEINKAAGQRNTSAMHYHFGGKERLIRAIIYEHYADIDSAINVSLDGFEQAPSSERTARNLLRSLVLPFVQQLDSARGINYLLIVRQVLVKSSDMLVSGHPDGEDRARMRVFRLARELMPEVPQALARYRMVLGAGLIFNALSSYAKGRDNSSGSRELFVSNLLDNLEALLTSPPSTETLGLLAKEG